MVYPPAFIPAGTGTVFVCAIAGLVPATAAAAEELLGRPHVLVEDVAIWV